MTPFPCRKCAGRKERCIESTGWEMWAGLPFCIINYPAELPALCSDQWGLPPVAWAFSQCHFKSDSLLNVLCCFFTLPRVLLHHIATAIFHAFPLLLLLFLCFIREGKKQEDSFGSRKGHPHGRWNNADKEWGVTTTSNDTHHSICLSKNVRLS